MTDESKPNIEPLELNKETLRDLTEGEAERVGGGAFKPDVNRSAGRYTCGDSCNCNQ
jgi:hypothetical protein